MLKPEAAAFAAELGRWIEGEMGGGGALLVKDPHMESQESFLPDIVVIGLQEIVEVKASTLLGGGSVQATVKMANQDGTALATAKAEVELPA